MARIEPIPIDQLSITEDDVAQLAELDPSRFTPREYRALRFFEMFATDHHAIDDDTFQWLAEVFTAAEIVELGFVCSQNLGNRFMHTLGVLQESRTLVKYSPDQVDASLATT